MRKEARPAEQEDLPALGAAARDEPRGLAVAPQEFPREPGPGGTGATGGSGTSLTPAMRQYLEQKAEVGDAILLFRIGDFYETFYDDAKLISRVLGLTLTARDKESANPVPLAGVPYHAVDGYVARLVRAGYKVAISEQVEDPRAAKGVVKRAVERIITPGTLTDEALLEARGSNCLAAVHRSGRDRKVGVAHVELSTGRFIAEMVDETELADELGRLRPAEGLVVEAGVAGEDNELKEALSACGAVVTARPGHEFDGELAERALCRHFGVSSLAGFGFDGVDAAVGAAGAILGYLRETQRAALRHIVAIARGSTGNWLGIDHVTLRALEVERTLRDGAREGSLLGAVDRTCSPMGGRRLRQWLCYPLRDAREIRKRQEAISALVGDPERLRMIRDELREAGDLERISGRLGVGRATPRDLVVLGRTLRRCAALRDVIGPRIGGPSEAGDLLGEAAAAWDGTESIAWRIAAALREEAATNWRDGGYIANGHHAELDRLREIERNGQAWLSAYRAREAESTGIVSLKVGYNSVFGYYIEVTNTHRDRVPEHYVRKQTVRNAERYITEELKRHEEEVLGAADRARALEWELFEALRTEVCGEMVRLQRAADALATVDAIGGLAELARERGFCRPELVEPEAQGRPVLEIIEGRHPVLEATLGARFVPNDCVLDGARERLLVITGPNMAGKSTYIRQVALLVLLAQTGSFVPAKSMRWSAADRIFARVGASDELSRGQSTFMVEMVETARILHGATADSVVVLDEIGRGTSTYDGLAIAWAVTEHLAERVGCRGLFATHYHELTELAEQMAGMANYHAEVREAGRLEGAGGEVVFLHRIAPGATDRSYGVHVAAMAGLPKEVVRRSEAVLGELERRFERTSRGRGMAARRAKTEAQPMLFGAEAGAPAPEWSAEVAALLKGIDVNRTTPMQALELIERLRALVAGRK